MGQAIGDIIPLAIDVALIPVPIVAIVVLGAKLIGGAIAGLST